ncbi:uncharacterized protein TRIADDRAFT_57264 [Trichoplax adhaerens]|uniref:Aminotransferase class V domain-containing protein n=1 Tax=Trichoplax adhaerens TaxID=10228 RepID=B3RYY8_TRIAD|nr:hypothetical protein TRIADDRAFT_57264 [Trichoplax adhaerens]EDV24109.1 hypothetical protein TRIADDRAFT_57264 [Trichoplax adhaerens]|eukprot:XP_002113635.1 hypothetical protein TRIADDRAFT_57264 [Trichoplax adhaerens]
MSEIDRSHVALAVSAAAGGYILYSLMKSRGEQDQADVKSKFGKEIRQNDFCYSQHLFILDHGSYGGVPRQVLKVKSKYEEIAEKNPFQWNLNEVLHHWRASIARVAELVGSSSNNLTFVLNATAGVMTALRSTNFTPNDGILINNLTYTSMQYAAQQIAEETGCKVYSVNFTFPIRHSQEIVNSYRQMFDEHPDIKFAIIDYIVSPTAMLMPIKPIIKLARERNIISFIDGAHAPGQIELHLDELGCDYFTGNMHKWAFTPRGCAIFYANSTVISQTHSLIVSHYRYKGFELDFYRQGTRDYSSQICAGAGVDYLHSLGGLSEIRNYNMKLREEAMNYIERELKGARRLQIPPDMVAPFMGVFELPDHKYDLTEDGVVKLRNDLYKKHWIEVSIKLIQQKLYCRFSIHVYTVMDDIVHLVNALKDVLRS